MEKTFFTNERTTQFLDFVKSAPTPYQTVASCASHLKNAGYTPLSFRESWTLEPDKSYFTIPYDTMLFAFHTPETCNEHSMFRMISSHTDHPGLRIKPNPDIMEKGYHKLNVEVYGGAILNTWLDRPLSIAGKIMLKGDQIFHPTAKIVDFKRPLLTIPNLAIHMNRGVNDGIALNRQTDLLPVLSLVNSNGDEEEDFLSFLATELQVEKHSILDFDLYIYSAEEGCLFGGKNELYSCPRIDNLSSVYAELEALCRIEHAEHDILIGAFYDNEEVGSKTKQGADSSITNLFLHKIANTLSISPDKFHNMLMQSFMISADVAHAIHPNHSEKQDPSNPISLNQGVVLKISSNQRYATDTEAISIIQQLCDTYAIPYQKFVNRSDIPGGSTLGSIFSSWLPMRTVDLGIPVLAMHSIRETAGVQDVISIMRLFQAFYNCER